VTPTREPSPGTSMNSPTDTLPLSWQRLLALSGFVFAALFVVGWFASGGVIAGTGEDSVFGFGFFPGVLALVIWSIATSIARYRAVATTREFVATEADA
jgi:hypothetical protein